MGKLTIQEIAKILVEKNKLSAKEANQFAAIMFEVIQQGLDSEGQVKIKGLGTFKKITVEARESVSVRTGERVVIDSHAKITFTPDALMKELVNKPFSQFDTVILNDGVEFEDMPDDDADDENAEAEPNEADVVVPSPVLAEENKIPAEEKNVTSEEPQPVIQPLMEIVDDETEEQDEVEEQAEEENDDEDEETTDEFEEDGSSWKKTLGYVLLTLLLMAGSAYAGYWYGQQHPVSVTPEPQEPAVSLVDSIEVVEVDSVASDSLPSVEKPVEQSPVEQPAAADKPQPKVDSGQAQQKEEPFWKKYEAMDVRVRTGAYHIVGTDREVKVRAGETLSRIARRELGEDMSCYIEVYNGLNAKSELKEGQVIKIPKLKWKKRRSID